MCRAVVLILAATAMGNMTAKRVTCQTERPPAGGALAGPIMGSVPPMEIDHAFRVRLADPIDAVVLRNWRGDRQLRGSGCQAVLSDFDDERGRSLADVLVILNVDAALSVLALLQRRPALIL